MSDLRQLPLNFPERPLAFDELSITSCNQAVIGALQRPELWPYSVFCLVGPPRCGLSTLAAAWAQRGQGVCFNAEEMQAYSRQALTELAGGYLAIDRADLVSDSEGLLFVMSAVSRLGGRLLLTAQTPPAHWTIRPSDLHSRLKAAPLGEIGPPDEDMIRARLQRAAHLAFFAQPGGQAILPEAVEDYLVKRLNRNYLVIDRAIALLAGATGDRPLTVPLVRDMFESAMARDLLDPEMGMQGMKHE